MQTKGGHARGCERGGNIPDHWFRPNISSYEVGKIVFEIKSWNFGKICVPQWVTLAFFDELLATIQAGFKNCLDGWKKKTNIFFSMCRITIIFYQHVEQSSTDLVDTLNKNTSQNALFSIGVTLSKMLKNVSKFTIFGRGSPVKNDEKCLKIH